MSVATRGRAAAAGWLWLAALTQCQLPQEIGPSPGSTERCIFKGAIRSFRPLDSRRLLIFADREYAVELLISCPSLETTETLEFISRDERICSYRADSIQTDRESCRIASILTLEEAERETLPPVPSAP